MQIFKRSVTDNGGVSIRSWFTTRLHQNIELVSKLDQNWIDTLHAWIHTMKWCTQENHERGMLKASIAYSSV